MIRAIVALCLAYAAIRGMDEEPPRHAYWLGIMGGVYAILTYP